MKTAILAAIAWASVCGVAFAQAHQPLPEAEHATIGYPSVEAALADLRSRSDVAISDQGGWTIVTETRARVLWSFPAKDHPAYPSAVRREIKPGPGGVYVEMAVQCEASKTACDDLVRSFQALNAKIAGRR